MSGPDASRTPAARTVSVDAETAGQRIDNFLMRELRGVPRTRVYRLLRKGEVRLNGGRVAARHRLAEGDRVRIPPVSQKQYSTGDLPPHLLERLREAVIHEDADALVIDKPAGLAVHAGSGIGAGVIDGLRALRAGGPRLELVHRLDRDTSGCLLVAKGRRALTRLQDELKAGGFRKTYDALLVGEWAEAEVAVEAPLVRDVPQSGERMVRVDPDGRPARSTFRRLATGAGLTLVEVTIATGRTHQIRVHAAHLGHPVLGDAKYGDPARDRAALGRAPKRMHLHARRLGFTGADGWIEVESERPASFERLLRAET